MISEIVVELSLWQFAITALFHFLFIPLTLGLSVLLAVLETLYVLGGQQIYRTTCRFWGRILAVNFALGVASRLALVFQFGMNGSYFSHYVGDVFAVPLAIEALSSFFLASLLFGPYLCGWERFSPGRHLLITWLLTLALNVSALLVLIAAGWLQNPVGAVFDYHALRMELSDLSQLFNNPPAISKAIHSITAAYVVAAATVLGISAWLLLKNPLDALARHSYRLAAIVGLVASLAVWLGDATPQISKPVQIRKLVVLEGGDSSKLQTEIETHIRNGVKAYALLQELRDDKTDPQLLADFNRLQADLGYGLLLQRWTEHVAQANDRQIAQAAQACLPTQPKLLFWIYRGMLACGVINLLFFGLSILPGYGKKPLPSWLLKLSIYVFPLSWLACIGGWFVAEAGMQPWAVAEILPSFLSVSSLSIKELLISLTAYTVFYGGLLAVGIFLIRQTLRAHLAASLPGVRL